MKLVALVAILVAAPYADVAAKCARSEQVPLVLTKPDAKIAADGGVLVGWQNQVGDDDATPDRPADPSNQPAWVGRAGTAAVALTRTQLAPGLTVYKPAKPMTGKLALRDGKGAVVASVTLGGAPVALAAPKVTRVTSTTTRGVRRQEVEVAAAVDRVPDDAIALIVSTTGAGAHATSFGRPAHDKPGATTVVVYEDPGHCGGSPPAMAPPAVGSKVTLAWVDASGRVSPASAEVAVQSQAGTP